MNEIKLDELIGELIQFNKTSQIQSMMELCRTHPLNHLCKEVIENNEEEWNPFFSIGNHKNLFAKGIERLNTWKHLMLNSSLFFSKPIVSHPDNAKMEKEITDQLNNLKDKNRNSYYFIFAALIIVFQVFGDGNHRTAQYFMELMNVPKINNSQMLEINNLMSPYDYQNITQNPIQMMHSLIGELIRISQLKDKKRMVIKRSSIKKDPPKNLEAVRLGKNIPTTAFFLYQFCFLFMN